MESVTGMSLWSLSRGCLCGVCHGDVFVESVMGMSLWKYDYMDMKSDTILI